MIHLKIHTTKSVRDIYVPEKWDELNDDQVALIAADLFAPITMNELEVRLVVILTGMKMHELRNTASEVMYEQLLPLVQWIIAGCDLTRQLIPVIRNKWGRNLYGPSSGLENMRLGEFDSAEKELFLYGEDTDNIDQLYLFIACLYRPGKLFFRAGDDSSDRRYIFDPTQTGRIAKRLKRILPLNQALAILLWYKGCRKKIHEDYQALFDGDESQEPGCPDYFPMMRMIAKENIYGDFDKVEQLYLFTALTEMLCALAERKAAEEMANKNNNQ